MFTDKKFDRKIATDLMEQLIKASGIPERHAEKMMSSYTGDNGDHSVYTVLSGMSVYLEESLGSRPERLESFKNSLNKKSSKIISKVLEDLR